MLSVFYLFFLPLKNCLPEKTRSLIRQSSSRQKMAYREIEVSGGYLLTSV